MEDVIICGGGPAGCAAAISVMRALPSARISVLEAGRYPRHKVCGEFLSPEAVAIFEQLVGQAVAADLRIHRVILNASGVSAALTLPVPAVSLTRYVLDHELWKAASRAGARCEESLRVLRVQRSADSFEVLTSKGALHARCVIDATGRWSELNRSTVGRTNLVGMKCHYEVPEPGPLECNLHFFAGGYLGRQPIGGSAVSSAALVDARLFRDMQQVFAAAGIGAVTAHWKSVTEMVVCPPVRFASPEPTRDGVLHCGDAAAFIDPFAGDGISLALHSGELAADHATRRLGGESVDEVAQSYERAYRDRFAGAFRTAARLRRFALGSSEWKRKVLVAAFRFPPMAQAALAKTRAAHLA